jgi:uncharacterized protein (DUF302 family)
MTYSISKTVELSYEEALEKVVIELQTEGFGILTTIDVKETLKKKLNVESGRYVILGACNPPFAYQALQAEREVGLLLPCNVIVYEDDSGSVVASAINPVAAMSMIDNEELRKIAEQVKKRLELVIERL